MSKPGRGRQEFAEDLERRRRPSMAAMAEAAQQLEHDRAGAAAAPGAGETVKPQVLLPEEEGHPHGQLTVAYNPASGQTWGFNFTEYPWRGDDSIRDQAARLDEFVSGGTVDGEPARWLEFTSPHDGRVHCLTREGAKRVLSVDHARTMGQVAPHSDQVALVRVRPDLLIPGGRRSA